MQLDQIKIIHLTSHDSLHHVQTNRSNRIFMDLYKRENSSNV